MSFTTTSIIENIRGLIFDNKNIDGRDAHVYDTSRKFYISKSYIDSTTIVVYLNGTSLSTDDWSYSSTTNQVTITPITSGVVLVKNDVIVITYSYYEKYSDTELVGYIKAALTYFVKFRYPKSFFMDSSNNILTRNGIQPTDNEADLISIVSAIHIDPKNVNIKMPDFTISAEESLSKTDQIQMAINNFSKSYGIVEFLHDGEE